MANSLSIAARFGKALTISIILAGLVPATLRARRGPRPP